jgi:sugar phosphate isomerase/epimerase
MSGKVSVGSSAFAFGAYASNPIPFERVISRLAELGFQGIELLGAKPYGDPEEIASPADRKALVHRCRDHGLEISNYGADFKEQSPASNDPEERKGYRKLFTKNLRFCVDCGIPSIRVDTVNEPPLIPGVSYDEVFKRFVDTWQQCAEEAQAEGVAVVWEFEPGFQFNKPNEVIKLVEAVGHPNFKVLFDACHGHMCAVVGARQEEPKNTLPGGEVEFARVLDGHIGYVHLIDSDKSLHDGWTSTHAPFGTGFVDFDALVDVIVESGYRDDWWTIDLCFWPKAWEILEESKRFMDDLLKRHGVI